MNLLRKHWPLLAIATLLTLVTLYVIAGHRQNEKGSLLPDLVPGEGLQLKKIHYTQDSPDKGMRWILDANEVKLSQDKRHISFRTFKLRLEPTSRPRVELEGDRGHYDKDSGEINLHGNLRGRTANGYSILTEHLLYNQKEGFIETKEPVKIFGPFFSMSGRGLHFNPQKENFKILSQVTTRITKGSLRL